jgi:hypothetical protein
MKSRKAIARTLRAAAATLKGSTAVDRSTDETVMEYAKQFLLKKKVKTIAAAARSTAKRLSGGENMMLGPGVTIIDAKKLEATLSAYIRDYGNQNGIWMAQHTFNLSDDEAAKLGISGSVRAGLMLSAGMKYDPENPAHRQELADKMKAKLGAAGFKLSTDRTRDPGREYGGGFKGKEEVWVFQHRKDPGLEVQVFTSITQGGAVRSKGADAIRVCLVVKNKAKLADPNSPDAKQFDLGSECRVHRTGDIDDIVERTVERARDAYKRANEVERCRDCQAPMATSKAGKRFCSEVCWTKKPGYTPRASISAADLFNKKPQKFSIESIKPGRNDGEFVAEVRLEGSGFATVRLYPSRMGGWSFTSTTPLSSKQEAALEKAATKLLT